MDFSTDSQSHALTVISFNVLAPCYYRLQLADRPPRSSFWERVELESMHEELFAARCEAVVKVLLGADADIVCLQEFWFHPAFSDRFLAAFRDSYAVYPCKRPGSKKDGCLTLVRNGLAFALDQTSHHLLSSSSSLTILFCGDFNASSRSPVYRLMEERGFLSSFQRAHGREALITHKDHRSRLVACDYIWFKQWFREEEEEEEGTQPKNGEEEEEEEETLLVHKQNKRMEERIRRVYVLKACLLPEGVPDEEWPEQQEGQFVSDHRPVLSSFRFG
ncbi:hypothetical protein QOT17_000984 [Balamuthia mandrillaris]